VGLKLCEVDPSGGTSGCWAPSGTSVDARAGQEFVLHGEDFLDSERFRLADQLGHVTIYASPASRSVRTFSVVLMAFGGAATLGCAVGLPVAVQSDSGTSLPFGIGLVGGLLSLAVSIPLFLDRTTYTLSGLGTYTF
jgi:hypothetical protein